MFEVLLILARICCRLNDMKRAIVNLIKFCHAKPQSSKVSDSSFSVFL